MKFRISTKVKTLILITFILISGSLIIGCKSSSNPTTTTTTTPDPQATSDAVTSLGGAMAIEL